MPLTWTWESSAQSVIFNWFLSSQLHRPTVCSNTTATVMITHIAFVPKASYGFLKRTNREDNVIATPTFKGKVTLLGCSLQNSHNFVHNLCMTFTIMSTSLLVLVPRQSSESNPDKRISHITTGSIQINDFGSQIYLLRMTSDDDNREASVSDPILMASCCITTEISSASFNMPSLHRQNRGFQ